MGPDRARLIFGLIKAIKVTSKVSLESPKEVSDRAFKIDILRAVFRGFSLAMFAKFRDGSKKAASNLGCFSRVNVALCIFTFGSVLKYLLKKEKAGMKNYGTLVRNFCVT